MSGVLFVSPNERQMLTHAGDRPPLGLMYLSAALEANSIRSEIVDLNHENIEDAIIAARRMKPDYIGISIPSTPTLQQGIRSGMILNEFGEIVFGGTGAATSHQELAGNTIKGVGEAKLVNLVTGKNEQFNIDTYPIPNRFSINNDRYNMTINGVRTTPMVSARGCAERCLFCGDINKRPQFRSLDNIVEELDLIVKTGYDGVYLYNENFLSSIEHAEGVCKEMNKRGLKYRVEARGADITPEVAKMLRKTGCMMVAVGVESADDYVLNLVRKGETLQQIEQGIRNLGRARIQSKGYFMFGLPGQTELSAHGSIMFAEKMKQYGMTSADFYAYTPYPGSVLANNLDKYGISLNTTDYNKFMQAGRLPVEPVIETRDLTSAQIKHFVSEGNRRFNGK